MCLDRLPHSKIDYATNRELDVAINTHSIVQFLVNTIYLVPQLIYLSEKCVSDAMKLTNDQFQPWQKIAVIAGLLTLLAASIFFLGCLLGIVTFDQFSVGGQSGLRTIAGVAISGCLLAAIGFWDK